MTKAQQAQKQKIKGTIRECLEMINYKQKMTDLEVSRYLDGYCTCLMHYNIVGVRQAKGIHATLMNEQSYRK